MRDERQYFVIGAGARLAYLTVGPEQIEVRQG